MGANNLDRLRLRELNEAHRVLASVPQGELREYARFSVITWRGQARLEFTRGFWRRTRMGFARREEDGSKRPRGEAQQVNPRQLASGGWRGTDGAALMAALFHARGEYAMALVQALEWSKAIALIHARIGRGVGG